ncbi:MAG: ABC transporter substrate-binding protein [Chloroflexi bacterium]|nr:ABC transporter substrate-binding protein [Chloroflexota bacterium]
MKKRIVWLVTSGLMVLSLVLASCAPKVAEEKQAVTEKKEVVTEKKEAVTEKREVVEKEQVEAKAEEPQYGGVLNAFNNVDVEAGFVSTTAFRSSSRAWVFRMTNEPLLAKDRLKGPAGTGEWNGLFSSLFPEVKHLTGNIAESWEVIQPDTFIFHIRKGIHWQDKPPANGAELTAEDVVFTWVFYWREPGTQFRTGYPYIRDAENPEKSIYLNPDDPWAVVVKSKPEYLALSWEKFANQWFVLPKALENTKGWFASWGDVVGTGPFLLTDYVRGSSLTWTKNPNYWKKDPLHPKNQLPYVDGVKVFIIPDTSTQLAALRTGKLDILQEVEAEDAEGLIRTNPQLQSKDYWLAYPTMAMRNDRAPFDNVNVRRAMTMAINYDEIVKDYYGGKALKFYWPAYPIPELAAMSMSLEEMPESVQELYGYHPDKAMKLLDAAGLPGPNRFTTSIIVSGDNDVDLLSIIKNYWAKVGVTLKIDVKEQGVKDAMDTAKSFEQGTLSGATLNDSIKLTDRLAGSRGNYAMVNDPLVEEAIKAIGATLYFDTAENARIIKKVAPEINNRAFYIRLPAPVVSILWQPWLRGYHGELPSYHGKAFQAGEYVWIDQNLKQKMMGRR